MEYDDLIIISIKLKDIWSLLLKKTHVRLKNQPTHKYQIPMA